MSKKLNIEKKIVGLSLKKAIAIAEEHGYKLRVQIKDNVGSFNTCDFLFNRINVEVENNKIKQVMHFG